MLALFFLPAVVALGFLITDSDGDDDAADVIEETPETSPGSDLDLLQEDQTNDGVFEGTENAEMMVGADAGSEISALGGDDVIEANGGDDTIDAGEGNDTVDAGEGNDSVAGGTGDDVVSLGAGDDTYGDFARTPAQQETMAGDDVVNGGAGQDKIVDHFGANYLRGGTGHDFIDARDGSQSAGEDTVVGGWGNDVMLIDDGDTATGGQGEDYFDLWIDENDVGRAVTITDFDPEEDVLSIFIGRSAEQDVPEITLDYDDTTNVATVLFDDVVVAKVLDIDRTAFPNIDVALVG